MTAKGVPHALPAALQGEVNIRLNSRELAPLNNHGRSTVRQLAADAFALGHWQGRQDQAAADAVDRSIELDKQRDQG